MKPYSTPIFVPFNIRNKIINENHGKNRYDIDQYKPQDQVQVLLSYLREKQIYNALKKSNLDILLKKKNNSPLHSMSISHGFHPILSRNHFENTIREYRSMSFQNVAFLGGLNSPISGTNLKAYWQFNESSGDIINQAGSVTGNSTLGSNANAQQTGSPTYSNSAGLLHNSVKYLDASLSYSRVGTDTGSYLSQWNFMHNTTAKFTYAFWMRSNNLNPSPGRGFLFSTGTYSDLSSIGLVFTCSGAGTGDLQPQIKNGGGIDNVCVLTSPSSGMIPDITNWHFYVLTYDQSLANTNMIFKRDDGTQWTGDKTAQTPSNSNATHAATWSTDTTLASSNWMSAYVQEWSIWADIDTHRNSQIYNNGAGKTLF